MLKFARAVLMTGTRSSKDQKQVRSNCIMHCNCLMLRNSLPMAAASSVLTDVYAPRIADYIHLESVACGHSSSVRLSCTCLQLDVAPQLAATCGPMPRPSSGIAECVPPEPKALWYLESQQALNRCCAESMYAQVLLLFEAKLHPVCCCKASTSRIG